MADRIGPQTVLVVGLGRFGTALAIELEALGNEVLAIDEREDAVQRIAGQVAHAVSGNATDPEVLRSLGVGDLSHAVIGIGNDIEASVLATAAIADMGVEAVWAKAVSAAHARILERVGATQVVFPERDMGTRVAHRVAGRLLEYLELDDDFVVVEVLAPADSVGRSLQELALRQRRGITVVATKDPGGRFAPALPDTVLAAGSVLLVAGAPAVVERFAVT